MSNLLNPPLRKEAFLAREMQTIPVNAAVIALLQKALASKCSFEELKELANELRSQA